jgi:hypothetical protein
MDPDPAPTVLRVRDVYTAEPDIYPSPIPVLSSQIQKQQKMREIFWAHWQRIFVVKKVLYVTELQEEWVGIRDPGVKKEVLWIRDILVRIRTKKFRIQIRIQILLFSSMAFKTLLRIRNLEAQKLTNPTDPAPEHWIEH